MSAPLSRNARDGAVALAVFAPAHALASASPLAPLALFCWLGFSFGALSLADELGAARPLNRAGLVLFAAAFAARVLMALAADPALYVRAEVLFAFAALGAALFWSVSWMHRPRARLVGALGTAAAGSALALGLAAHILAGGAALFGFGALFRALDRPTLDPAPAVLTVDVILALWGIAAAGLMRRNLVESGKSG